MNIFGWYLEPLWKVSGDGVFGMFVVWILGTMAILIASSHPHHHIHWYIWTILVFGVLQIYPACMMLVGLVLLIRWFKHNPPLRITRNSHD